MKNIFLFCFVIAAISILSCKKESLLTTHSNNPVVGEWSVSTFIDNSINKTSEFSSYIFSFDNNSNMTISGGNAMMSMCNWSFTDSAYHFDMMGMHSNVLDDLNGDWKLMNFSDSICDFIGKNTNVERSLELHRLP